jgi:hypothetical protein
MGLSSAGQPLDNEISPLVSGKYVDVITDQNGFGSWAIRTDGTVQVSQLQAVGPVYDNETSALASGTYVDAITDQYGFGIFAIKADGTVKVAKLESDITPIAITGVDDSAGNYYQVEKIGTSYQIVRDGPATNGAKVQLTALGDNYAPAIDNSLAGFLSFTTNRIGAIRLFKMLLNGSQQFPYQWLGAQLTNNEFKHIQITGQSLGNGFGSQPVLSTTQAYNNKMLNTGVNANSSGAAFTGLVPLVETLVPDPLEGANQGETIASGMTNQLSSQLASSGSVGCSLDFTVSDSATSGRSIAEISRGTTFYGWNLSQITAIRGYALAAGKTFRAKALCLIHGEADTAFSSATYLNDVLTLLANFNTDVAAITGQTEEIKLLICQQNSWTKNPATQPGADVPMAQYLIAVQNPTKVAFTTPKYHLPYGDGVHLTAAGERWLGEYYGKAYDYFILRGYNRLPLYPISATISGAVITATFNVPSAPIVFDTTLVSNPGNFGFEYFDNSGAPPAISNVAISGNTVIVTLASVPTGSARRFRYAYTGTSGANAGATTGPRGNLRDSDPYPSLYGNTLYNWCPAFNIAIT